MESVEYIFLIGNFYSVVVKVNDQGCEKGELKSMVTPEMLKVKYVLNFPAVNIRGKIFLLNFLPGVESCCLCILLPEQPVPALVKWQRSAAASRTDTMTEIWALVLIFEHSDQ